MATRPIKVVLRRKATPEAPARWQTIVAELDPDHTVLEALEHLRAEHNPSISFRCACRHGVCGECAIDIGGRPALACTSRLGDHLDWRGSLRLAPLGGLVQLRDLIVDRGPFWDSWRSARPWLEAEEAPPEPDRERRMSPDEHKALGGADACIRCGVCWSACPVVRSGSGFAGPQAMLETLSRVQDPRDGSAASRLDEVGGDQGVWRCHGVLSCLEHCPIDLSPADAIFELRQLTGGGGGHGA